MCPYYVIFMGCWNNHWTGRYEIKTLVLTLPHDQITWPPLNCFFNSKWGIYSGLSLGLPPAHNEMFYMIWKVDIILAKKLINGFVKTSFLNIVYWSRKLSLHKLFWLSKSSVLLTVAECPTQRFTKHFFYLILWSLYDYNNKKINKNRFHSVHSTEIDSFNEFYIGALNRITTAW